LKKTVFFLFLTALPPSKGWVGIWRCIGLGGHSRIDVFVVFPSEIRQMPGNKVAYRANKRESSLSAVSLRPCEPLALIPVNGQNPEIGGYFWIEKFLQHAPLGSPGADPSKRKLPFSSLFRPLSECFT
jgi:hypothetical protein